MRKQIKRLSPHQNGKVCAVLMAVSSLIFVLPMFLMFSFSTPQGAHAGPPAGFILIMPIFYLIFGYVSVVIGCVIYNFLFKFIGGFEFESVSKEIDE